MLFMKYQNSSELKLSGSIGVTVNRSPALFQGEQCVSRPAAPPSLLSCCMTSDL